MRTKADYFVTDFFLKPVTTATETIITVKPKAIPASAIRIMRCDNSFLFALSKKSRRDIKSSVFKIVDV